ncbi:type II secretion system F family protein [Candidatus Microgenomates bacterium]|jgi:type IV pilus assembly protein PilC|nr:MAG: type II secretion system F family protein [Candidatus Microgenomates bacterium]
MATYTYRAKDAKGNDVAGDVEARDQKQAIAILKEKHVYPFSIKEKNESFFEYLFKKFFKKTSVAEVATFTRQLATMINAGLPLTEALLILKSQGSSEVNKAAAEILRDVEGGSTLADSMARFPKIFSSVYIALVKAGESAGVLDNILNRLADNLEAQREFKAKVKGALIYPAIVISGMVVVMFIMMIFVIPKLTSLYEEFDAELPQTTEILISISNFMVNFWWLFLVGIVGASYLYRMVSSQKEGKRRIDQIKFRIPIFGTLHTNVILAELTRTLGLLVGAGVSIIEALTISAGAADNVMIEEGIMVANKQVEKGLPLSEAIGENPLFPQIVSQMISVGEETGKMDEVLLKVSKYFQSESEESLKGLTSAIEPLIMVLLGVGVGFMVIAIIMPIYNLTSQF